MRIFFYMVHKKFIIFIFRLYFFNKSKTGKATFLRMALDNHYAAASSFSTLASFTQQMNTFAAITSSSIFG